MPLTAPALLGCEGVVHGFFTREGGVSEGPFASLNMGLKGGDAAAAVARNRAIAATALGCAGDRLVTARQVHGVTALPARAPWPAGNLPEADALVTTLPGLLVGVVTADCAPVLLADPVARVVGAAHAGWRGALAGILEATIEAMVGAGAVPSRTTAVCGPCIGRASYEVGPEFEARFRAEDLASAVHFDGPNHRGRPHFDLAAYVIARLRRAGVGTVAVTGEDTCADPRFFSNRRAFLSDDPRFGLQLSAIGLRDGGACLSG